MRIAMITNNYRPFVGGVPVSVERQTRELMRLGHEVTVFAPVYGDTEAEDQKAPERVIRYRTQKRKMDNGMVYPGLFPQEILDTFVKEQFDLIHVHHPMFAGPCALYLRKKYGTPVVYTYHTRYEEYLHYIPMLRLTEKSTAAKKKAVGWLRERVIPSYMGWFAGQCDLVVAPSAGMRQIIRNYGVQTRVEVLPTGLDENFFQRTEKDRSAKIRDCFCRGRKHLLVTVSRLEKEKNYGFLLRGIAEMKSLMGDEFHVMIIGDGSGRAELKVKASLLGIQDMVTFVGNVPNREVKDYLEAADLFLFASKSETQGIVLAEAMAAGCPVIAVSAVGTDDIIRDGLNGFITAEDEEEWALRAISALDPERNQRMSAQARQDAENYRSARLAIYEEMLYNQCIREKRDGERIQEQIQSGGRKEESIYEEENRAEHPAMYIR